MSAVEKIVSILKADWQCQDEYLERDQVERLLDKRQASPDECLEVYQHLARPVRPGNFRFDSRGLHRLDAGGGRQLR